ncbi:MAG: sensor histidine kinase [Gemmatimonadaceae bacterium]
MRLPTLAELPSAFRLRWPTALLALSLLLTGAGIVEATRAVRSQRRVADGVVRDYSRVASWSFRQHLQDALSLALREVLGAVNHGDNLHTSPHIPEPRELAHYLPWNSECGCHRPRNGPSPAIFFGFTLGTDTLGLGVNTHPNPVEGWEVDRPMPLDTPMAMPMSKEMSMSSTPDAPRVRVAEDSARIAGYSAGDRRWINDTLTRQIRHARGNDRFNFVVADRGGTPRFLAYTLMPTTRGDTIVYGAEYTRAAMSQALVAVLYNRDLLPLPFTRAHTVPEVLQVQLRDIRGTPIFEPQAIERWDLDASDTLPPALGSMVVRAEVRPAIANDIVIGGLPRSRLPFLLALLAISASLSIVAIGQIRRDVELARLRGDFVSSVSHDLRTPLAQMRLYLETLRLGRFTTEEQRAASIEHAERETTRLTHLVERVLRFSGNGKNIDGSRVEVDVAAETRRIVEEFRPLAESRRASIITEIAAVPPIQLSPDALRHVLLNLLDNAVKYGPSGQTVRVSVSADDDDIRLTVTDEGPGVPVAEREVVWSPFRRGASPGPVAGSGIGLAIVRDVATRHGGRTWIENGAARGATFVVSLPIGVPVA